MMLGVIPAALVVVAAMLVHRLSGRRFLLFLLALSVALLLLVLVAGWLTPAQDNRPGFMVINILMPVILGVLALVLLHLKEFPSLRRGEKALALLLGLITVALLVGAWEARFGVTYAVLPGAVILAVVWAIGRAFRSLAAVFSVVALVFLGLCNALTTGALTLPAPARALAAWISIPAQLLYFALPGLVVGTAALLVSTGLKLIPPSSESASASWRPMVGRLALAVVLLGYLIYTIVWASIWDQTSDGLGGLALSMPAGLAAIAAGMVMAATAYGWRRLAGLGFGLLVPAALFGAFNYGWGVSYHSLTESRAAAVQEALESFHSRTGSYPTDLRQLVPSELWWIPAPVILSGQGWCYQGERDSYRLGAIYREFFSMPLSVHLYASAGSPPDIRWECDEKLVELKPRYDPPSMVGMPDTVPTLAPLTTSVVSVQRMSVQPLIRSSAISVGEWSPDGRYLLFGLQEVSGGQSVIGLNFLNVETGRVCPAGDSKWETTWASDGLREQSAWLPDGRLLYLSANGEMVLFRPCTTGMETLTSRYSQTFSQVDASDERSGRVLLKNAETYWILDASSLEVLQIAEVSPNPYEAHRDSFAWSPDGERLAVVRLNGRERQDGATLYVVAGTTGEVERSFPLEGASDQRAPGVEWLSNDEMLIFGSRLDVLDLRSDPAQFTNLVRDVFLLDVAYPEDFSSLASIVDKAGGGYHIAVRVNHPHNQSTYVYHSETGQVQVLQSEVNLLLLFPDGQSAELLKSESVPTYRDEYDLMWLDTPAAELTRFVVQGHVPRTYPLLYSRYLSATSQMVFASSQGLSLVALPDGKLLDFWELQGGSTSPSTFALASPDGKALVAIVEGVGLYYIPLPSR
jgi:hypothetical protein